MQAGIFVMKIYATPQRKPFYSHYLQSILSRFVHQVLWGINIYFFKKAGALLDDIHTLLLVSVQKIALALF